MSRKHDNPAIVKLQLIEIVYEKTRAELITEAIDYLSTVYAYNYDDLINNARSTQSPPYMVIDLEYDDYLTLKTMAILSDSKMCNLIHEIIDYLETQYSIKELDNVQTEKY